MLDYGQQEIVNQRFQLRDAQESKSIAMLNQDWQQKLELVSKADEVDEDQPLTQRISNWIRASLLSNFTNKIIFYDLYEKNIVKSEDELQRLPLSSLIKPLIYSQSENIMFALFFINFASNANLISFVFPLSALFYGILESP